MSKMRVRRNNTLKKRKSLINGSDMRQIAKSTNKQYTFILPKPKMTEKRAEIKKEVEKERASTKKKKKLRKKESLRIDM